MDVLFQGAVKCVTEWDRKSWVESERCLNKLVLNPFLSLFTIFIPKEMFCICCKELQKSGISGSTQASEEFPELPRHLQ